MTEPVYIASLHRPFNQQLKPSKWICTFVDTLDKSIPSSQILSEFYYYLIKTLNKEYQKELPDAFNGLPSDVAINSIWEYIQNINSKKEFLSELPNIILDRKTVIDKQIYSTYKAASYYLNLAKDKFNLISPKNTLTVNGKALLEIKSNFFRISQREATFYFERILEADFHLFITHCLFIKLGLKYNLKSVIAEQSEFINDYLKIKHFNFTSSSLSNYNIVRNSWVESLNVLDAKFNIRRNYIEIINSNVKFYEWYNELLLLFKKFENEGFKEKMAFVKRKGMFLKIYKQRLKKDKNDLGFINLHNIKGEMRISAENFQKFLVEFYESEKKNRNIYFSNTVNSIDTRERFYIRNRPVIKIKIKDK
ncbi:hypothetical protein [Sphingobacterium haloxyli]|uniref:Uncharacterized protein n=1 Tax=Sphingobacterium haloxyli TaxID=2100533 RepID=A0A2S9J5G6_9SPHI|nr:hypothetical protein [Sphingobacterium haloxyli]PRD48022.1 hypothetical protein C5745_05785 [Sphingobacterium haloxyli]